MTPRTNHTHITHVIPELPAEGLAERKLRDAVAAALIIDNGANGAEAKLPEIKTLGDLRKLSAEEIAELTGLEPPAVEWLIKQIGQTGAAPEKVFDEGLYETATARSSDVLSTVLPPANPSAQGSTEANAPAAPIEPERKSPSTPTETAKEASQQAAEGITAPPPLSKKEERFVEEYLVDYNASGAARRAGYSERSAGTLGNRLLKKVEICRAIDAKMTEQAGLARPFMASILANIARGNMGDFTTVDEHGNVSFNLGKLDRDQWAAIQELTQVVTMTGKGDDAVPERTTKVKLRDPANAIEKLARVLDKFTERRIHGIDDSLAGLLREIDGKSRAL